MVLDWARNPAVAKPTIEEIADQLRRSVGAVKQFLRRVLPPGERPWVEKPRWSPAEVQAVQDDAKALPTRSLGAVRKYAKRHCRCAADESTVNEQSERSSLTVTRVAADLGLSRASVYRLLEKGMLRRFKGAIAETSFTDLLRDHPEAVPYSKLPRDYKEWLVLNGYPDPSLDVKRPSTKGLLD